MNKTQTKAKAAELVKMAMQMTGEGEPLDLTDNDFTLENIVRMKAILSNQRRAIDMVNKAFAQYWDEIYHDEVYEEEFTKWSVGTTAGKRIIDDDAFFNWLASKSAIELTKLISATAIKVGGMTPAERDTLLDETPTNMNLTIKNSRRY
jgi:uncharacterized protein YecA (UPF0149 family)